MKDYREEHELLRKKIWSDAYLAASVRYKFGDGEMSSQLASGALHIFDKNFQQTEKADQ